MTNAVYHSLKRVFSVSTVLTHTTNRNILYLRPMHSGRFVYNQEIMSGSGNYITSLNRTKTINWCD